ncbi:hypothetical protein HOH87_01620, partial [bacterium]|nr:hypothetical protein [bacterium]
MEQRIGLGSFRAGTSLNSATTQLGAIDGWKPPAYLDSPRGESVKRTGHTVILREGGSPKKVESGIAERPLRSSKRKQTELPTSLVQHHKITNGGSPKDATSIPKEMTLGVNSLLVPDSLDELIGLTPREVPAVEVFQEASPVEPPRDVVVLSPREAFVIQEAAVTVPSTAEGSTKANVSPRSVTEQVTKPRDWKYHNLKEILRHIDESNFDQQKAETYINDLFAEDKRWHYGTDRYEVLQAVRHQVSDDVLIKWIEPHNMADDSFGFWEEPNDRYYKRQRFFEDRIDQKIMKAVLDKTKSPYTKIDLMVKYKELIDKPTVLNEFNKAQDANNSGVIDELMRNFSDFFEEEEYMSELARRQETEPQDVRCFVQSSNPPKGVKGKMVKNEFKRLQGLEHKALAAQEIRLLMEGFYFSFSGDSELKSEIKRLQALANEDKNDKRTINDIESFLGICADRCIDDYERKVEMITSEWSRQISTGYLDPSTTLDAFD